MKIDLTVDNDNLFGIKRKLITGCGNTHLIAFFDIKSGDLMEVFYMKGSTGGCISSFTAISRLISLASRSGIPVEPIIGQLKSTEPCPAYRARTVSKKDTSRGTSCPNAIGHALVDMINDAREMVSKNSLNGAKGYEETPLASLKEHYTGVVPTYAEDLKPNDTTIYTDDSTIREIRTESGVPIRCSTVEPLKHKHAEQPYTGVIPITDGGAVERIDKKDKAPQVDSEHMCPECDYDLVYSGGCMVCNACGWSRCD